MPTITSPVSASSTATVTETGYWLKDPLDPTRNRQVWVTAFDKVEHPREAAVFEPLPDPSVATTLAVVAFGALRGQRGSVAIHCASKAERDAVQVLVDTKRALLLQMPPETVGEYGEQWYIATLGSDQARLFQGQGSRRVVSTDWIEVAAP